MIKLIRLVVFIIIIITGDYCYGQSTAIKSAIINFGSNTCGNTNNVTFSSIGNPATVPYLISSCVINPPFSDVYSKFISYNPKDNKIYINDISSGDSRVYIYDMGLPYNYTCPSVLPVTPNYHYSYIPNNWEFDINGDIWCVKGLSGTTATIERIDEATGTILFTKTLDFPSDNVPNTLGSGDIVILPNGRFYMVMGDSPSKFFEITNYSSTSGNATATFIQNMPRPCYGILYLNGSIELTGTDLSSSCYKYVYDIPSYIMGPELPFQLGITPIDNSSISPATGLSKILLAGNIVDNSTADIVYEVYARNLGNVRLNNFNIVEDLGSVFGVSNISNVSVALQSGLNPDNLILNSAFDGVTNTRIFKDSLIMSNLNNGYVGLTISFRVTNLLNNKIYYTTSKSIGEIGEGGIKVLVTDSSNNGNKTVIDPNNDGDAGDVGENVPTPFYFGIVLPVNFIDLKAARVNRDMNVINWTVAPTQTPLEKFEVEYSDDHIKWQSAGIVIADKNTTSYLLNHSTTTAGSIFYRVRAYEKTGKSYRSNEVVVREQDEQNIVVKPNPADGMITLSVPDESLLGRTVYITNVSGKKIFRQKFSSKSINIDCSYYPDGYYIINILDRGKVTSTGVVVSHR